MASHFELLVDGKSAFGKLFHVLEQAKKSIYVEIFLLTDDKTGWDFALILAKKARQGIDVRLIYDQIGTYYFSLHNLRSLTGRVALLRFLATQGVKIEHAGNPNPFRFQLDHRKIIVVDSIHSFTGGMNIGDSYQFDWHDILIYFSEPSISIKFEKLFLYEWSKKPVHSEKTTFAGNNYSLLVTALKKHDIQEDLHEHINKATKYIYIEVPYFTDLKFVHALIKAKSRGVDVKIIVPNRPNHILPRIQHVLTLMLMQRAKIEIFYYKSTLNHLKVFLFDDEYVSIGSANATYRSMIGNKELNLGTNDKLIIKEVKSKIFTKDFDLCKKG